MSYASSGTGGIQHLATELFKSMARVDILHVPYKETGPGVADVMAGQVHLTFASIVATLQQVLSRP